ncbi:homeobox-leucine zipper protein HAT4-like protein [Carex littledalei]|uniref:Homeobox-leucine zipper protein HAT4-like protein n=1 Tax=Carex littledalei TaxID=544730 RepID=A0A833QEY7_9POAL|nr:homeobox-leucine zipper protein HAT4-like protein [Carex littledalei]
MVEKEDLGLSLSLNSSTNNWQNLTSSKQSQSLWNSLFSVPENRLPELRGIDVNRTPVATAQAATESCESDEEAGASCSPNCTLSKDGGSRKTERGISDEEDGGSRKKLRLSKDQAAVLEESFKEHSTLNPKQKAALAKQLNLKPRQVEVWTKLKQTEVDCDFLKRCCENLTEENRRLQKEVQELRALKLLSPQVYMHIAPPTTLILCPSCERVSNNSATSACGTGTAPPASAPNMPWMPIPIRPTIQRS